MKGKYITSQILLACLARPVEKKEETDPETKKAEVRDVELMEQWKIKIQSSAGNDETIDKKAA